MNLRELGRLVLRRRNLGHLGNLRNLKSLNLGYGELRSGNYFGLNLGQRKRRRLHLRGGRYLGNLGNLVRLDLRYLRRGDRGGLLLLLLGDRGEVLNWGFRWSNDRERRQGRGGCQDRGRSSGSVLNRGQVGWGLRGRDDGLLLDRLMH